MRIAFYHHVPLPVKTYGGTERILFWHMKELVRQGHDVVLLGHPESEVEEYGIKLIPLEGEYLRDKFQEKIPKDIDILHLQFNPSFELDIPLVCTVHGNGQPGETFHNNSVFVSGSHAKNHNSNIFIANALDFEEYPAPDNINKKGKDNLLFLAKASWRVKNLSDCKKVAKKTKKHLHIIGGKTFSFSKYIHNHGFVGGKEKLDLIRQCDALVFPVRWNEPFGLAMTESMSQGLPIFGSQNGSLPEVIGEAGRACANYEEFLNAVQSFDCKLSPQQIRDYCYEKYNIDKYSRDYLKLYEKIIGGSKLSKEVPKFLSNDRAETLIDF